MANKGYENDPKPAVRHNRNNIQSQGWEFKVGKRIGLRENVSSIHFLGKEDPKKKHHASKSVRF